MKATLTLLVGIPGSGKSTWAKNNCGKSVVLSSDLIRKEILGSEEDQTNNDLVFKTLYVRAKELLNNNVDVIIDATNATVFDRKRSLDNFKDLNIFIKAIVFNTPAEVCRKRDKQRTRTVGDEVIDMFLQKYEEPTTVEGFNQIDYINYVE